MSYIGISSPCILKLPYNFKDIVKVNTQEKGIITGMVTNFCITESSEVLIGVEGLDGYYFDYVCADAIITKPTGSHVLRLCYSIGGILRSLKYKNRMVIYEVLLDYVTQNACYYLKSSLGTTVITMLMSPYVLEDNYFKD